ncbi:DISARM system phospholipase D-like protein DrmC [Streptomyces sp. HK10]|uniref:DISARM system phospholipase D-like protein DrmC n=1 Tax=Streptomyces sp. HK10 TaxID=3373255 RepID=UPI0037484D2F
MTPALAGLLAKLAGRLPRDRTGDWAGALSDARGPDDPALDRFAAQLLAAGLAHHLDRVRRAWREEAPQLTGAALALALEASAVQYETCRPGRLVEPVVSGPVSPSVPVRLTSGVAVDVIRSARETLLVASFAAYGVGDVVEELRRAVRRGVTVDLLLEESTAAVRAFAPLHGHVRVWHRTDGTLHAKAVVADRHTALLGSANLTDRALRDNIEIGVIVRGPEVVGRIADHLRWLIRPGGGPLRPVGTDGL